MWIIRNKRLVFTPTPTPTVAPDCDFSLIEIPDCDFSFIFTPTPTLYGPYGPTPTPTKYSPLGFKSLNYNSLADSNIDENYKSPNKRDMAVCLAFFSPVGSKNLLLNYNRVKNKLDKAKIPNYTIELTYNNKNLIKDPFVRLNTNSIMFHKENLWNIMANKISKRYKKLLFLDADIMFTNPNWYNDLSIALDFNDIVQPFESAVWQNSKGKFNSTNPCSAQFIGLNKKLDFSTCHPGFAWAMTRSTFDKINGFYEYQVLGAGDALFAMALNKNEFLPGNYGYHYSLASYYQQYVDKIKKYSLKINYLNNCNAVHLYHGSLENRNYGGKEIPKNLEFIRTKDGLLEWKNQENNQIMIRNFSSRKEDF